MQSIHQHVSLMPPLAFELNRLLFDYSLTDAFAQSRNEASLIFNKGQEQLTIRLNTDAKTGLLFFDEHGKERSGSVYPLFKQLLNAKVLKVFAHKNNRSIAIDFNNNLQLVFKLYGPLSNIILFDEHKVIGLFRQSIENDWLLEKDGFDKVNEQVIDTAMPVNYFVCAVVDGGKRKIVLSFEPGEAEILLETQNIFEALTFFAGTYIAEFQFQSKKQALIQKYQQALKKQQGLLHGANTRMHHLKTQTPPEEIAHIIMANLHQLKKGETQVTLFDFYRNQDIEIKLKKEWSPQENAEQYYKKSKNKKQEWVQTEQQIEKSTLLIAQLEKDLEKAKGITHFKEFKKEQSPESIKQQKGNIAETFKQFECNGYNIYVGKNSVNNDQLTLKFAHKDDLWLHAKGVSGSHVIVKHKIKNSSFPQPVIEFAAKLAAYYSKSKSSNLVPVIYTFKKFVRKPKGALAGQVIVEKEEMIMVEPKLPK